MREFKKGQLVKGIITGIEKYGAFLKIDEECNGLIHISQISDRFVRDINSYLKVGDEISAIVLEDNIDTHLKLSIKEITKTTGNRRQIKETSAGFSTLKSMLDDWIKEKHQEKIDDNAKN